MSHWAEDGGGPVQKREGGGKSTGSVHEAAQKGTSGAGGALPHLDKIQQSFGPKHDVSGVQAHVTEPIDSERLLSTIADLAGRTPSAA